MSTKLLYLDDTYHFTAAATFLGIQTHEKGLAVILDQTIFYPQGGGQPSDTGYIRSASGIFNVTHVALGAEGVVCHIGTFETGSFLEGESVTLEIDGEKRILHARLHSAGHLVDIACTQVGLNLKPGKGYHFPQGPYVEYQGEIQNLETYVVPMEQSLQQLIDQNIPFKKELLSETEAQAKNMYAPLGKEVRIVAIGHHEPCGCGGTHVAHTGELKAVRIRKISSKKGITRISYEVA